MRLFSKLEPGQPSALNLRDDRLNYLIDKLGIGGTNAMNITWDDLANILVFLLEAEARRLDEADPNGADSLGQAGKEGSR
jgi:hypothetical protein